MPRWQKDKNLHRMVSLGQLNNSSDLNNLRTSYIQATNILAQTIWPNSIIDTLPTGKTID
jgi:hypothetical protein